MAKKKEYTEKEVRENMAEIKTGKRIFETKKYGLVQIRFSGVEENRLADWEYSRVFNQALLDGLPTNKEMQRIIEQRKLWTEEDDKKVEELREEINKQLVVLSKMETEKNKELVEDKINTLRQKLYAIQEERQRYFNNTAESKAEEARLSFLIHKCTEFADPNRLGEPVWKSYSEFKNEEDQETVNFIVFQFMTFINGLPADFLSVASTNSEEAEEVSSDSK